MKQALPTHLRGSRLSEYPRRVRRQDLKRRCIACYGGCSIIRDLQRVDDVQFLLKKQDQDRHPPLAAMMTTFCYDSPSGSPIGSLKNWKPYIFEILEHFLDRELHLELDTKLHEQPWVNMHQQPHFEENYGYQQTQEKWEVTSEKLYEIQRGEGQYLNCRTIQRALILTKITLLKLSALCPLQTVDFGLIAFSALRIALKVRYPQYKNQSNSLSLRTKKIESQYSQNDLSQAQIFIVNTLDWRLNVPTPYELISCLLFAINPDVQWLPFIQLCEKVAKYCLTHYELCCSLSSTIALTAILVVSENYNFDEIELETTGVEFQFALVQHLSSSSLSIEISQAILLKKRIILNLYEDQPECKFMRQAVRNHNELIEELVDQELVGFEEMTNLTLSANIEGGQSVNSLLAEEHSLTFTICNDLAHISLQAHQEERNSPEEYFKEGLVHQLHDSSRASQDFGKMHSSKCSSLNQSEMKTNPDSQFSSYSSYRLKSMKESVVSRKRSFNLVKRIEETMNQKYEAKSKGSSPSLPSSVDQLNQQLQYEEL